MNPEFTKYAEVELAKSLIKQYPDTHLAVRHLLHNQISIEVASTALTDAGVSTKVVKGRIKGQIDIGIDGNGFVKANDYLEENVPMLVFGINNPDGKTSYLI